MLQLSRKAKSPPCTPTPMLKWIGSLLFGGLWPLVSVAGKEEQGGRRRGPRWVLTWPAPLGWAPGCAPLRRSLRDSREGREPLTAEIVGPREGSPSLAAQNQCWIKVPAPPCAAPKAEQMAVEKSSRKRRLASSPALGGPAGSTVAASSL